MHDLYSVNASGCVDSSSDSGCGRVRPRHSAAFTARAFVDRACTRLLRPVGYISGPSVYITSDPGFLHPSPPRPPFYSRRALFVWEEKLELKGLASLGELTSAAASLLPRRATTPGGVPMQGLCARCELVGRGGAHPRRILSLSLMERIAFRFRAKIHTDTVISNNLTTTQRC
jgi:hypothetical protein